MLHFYSIQKYSNSFSQVEDPEVLLRHQQVQQSKSIHELSKIRNLNEFPLPLNLKLPDLPLPSAKKMLKLLARYK
jgi:hypothetical protein